MIMRARYVAAVGAAVLGMFGLTLLPADAAPSASFQKPMQLDGAAGGEPSIAADGLGNMVITGPQGIPSVVGGTPGVAVWVSHDDAKGFKRANQASFDGSYLGGGDSDVAMTPDTHDVYITDLEAAAAAVCKSTDHGDTFQSIGPAGGPCGGVTAGQAGPSNDRQWLTFDKGGRGYLTYHEFVSALPVAWTTADGGNDGFATPCGPLVTDPQILLNTPTDITGGTLVSKPVVDAAGNLYVLFTTTTQQQNALAFAAGKSSGTFSQMYMAVSTDHCATFTNYTVFDGASKGSNTVQFGDIFNDLVIDSAGNLYAVAAGAIGEGPTAPQFPSTANLYLFTSQDQGKTWSAPISVASPKGAHVLPAAVAGPKPGSLALGFFRTVNGVTDPNSADGQWTYSAAVTTNALASKVQWTAVDLPGKQIMHSGDICTSGILCGTGIPGTGNDRSLLDFTSAALDSHGNPVFTFAGNPAGAGGTWNYVSKLGVGW
jgi:hypothetical protein